MLKEKKTEEIRVRVTKSFKDKVIKDGVKAGLDDLSAYVRMKLSKK